MYITSMVDLNLVYLLTAFIKEFIYKVFEKQPS